MHNLTAKKCCSHNKLFLCIVDRETQSRKTFDKIRQTTTQQQQQQFGSNEKKTRHVPVHQQHQMQNAGQQQLLRREGGVRLVIKSNWPTQMVPKGGLALQTGPG